MNDELTKLTAKAAELRAIANGVEKTRDEAIKEATRLIKNEYSAHLKEVDDAARAAENAAAAYKRDLLDATTHPWEGKKVKKIISKPISRWSSRCTLVTIYGVVEVCRTGTVFAENIGVWRQPDKGTAFVRLLKSDDKPGLKFEYIQGWELADETAA